MAQCGGNYRRNVNTLVCSFEQCLLLGIQLRVSQSFRIRSGFRLFRSLSRLLLQFSLVLSYFVEVLVESQVGQSLHDVVGGNERFVFFGTDIVRFRCY